MPQAESAPKWPLAESVRTPTGAALRVPGTGGCGDAGVLGCGDAGAANVHFKRLLAEGVRALSVPFDLPTGTGRDSDTPGARGEIGHGGVAVDSIDDVRVLLGGIPLDRVHLSLEADAPAAVLLLLCQLVAEEQGFGAGALTGSLRHDVLGGPLAPSGTALFPPAATLRLMTDTFAYCRAEVPRWETLAVLGGRLAEAGATPVQEVALSLAHGLACVRAARSAGLEVAYVAPRLTLSYAAHRTRAVTDVKVLAARRIWARAMREEFGATDTEPLMPRFHLAGRSTPERPADSFDAAVRELAARIEESSASVGAVLPPNAALELRQAERLAKLRAWRDQHRLEQCFAEVGTAAAGEANVLYPMRSALAAGATVGEVCGVLGGVWGTAGAEF
ncbi:methylmalonyl-CoA mutase family protein [Streptomyces sp. NPDC051561]|uniref:methylmalonyl-CoA mutase family protein n=1 Tax=Streptomyces sp. NPDC051561 TaxID=3365658 RepID=UPI0037A1C955